MKRKKHTGPVRVTTPSVGTGDGRKPKAGPTLSKIETAEQAPIGCGCVIGGDH